MPTDREAGMAAAIEACRKLVDECDELGCCDLCGGFDGEHLAGCLYIDALTALKLLGIKE